MMMAASSSKNISQDYDVFMSFRGEDTRTGFTSHLYDALVRNDIITYKDDKTLEIGNAISCELLEAIEASRIAIVVLSNNFATSKWCLEEIAKIVECKEHGKLIVIPIFYHVDPSDVRRQGNCFQKCFSDHEANPKIEPHNVERWRDAFRKVGALSGLHVTQHRNEAEVVSEIVKLILKNMPETLPIDVTNGLVGIDSRMDEVIRLMRLESSEVLFVGICGMSGIGKTTLAEAVFNHIKKKYNKSSFIENIKDISKQDNSTDLCKLQQKLLDDILKEKSVRVQSVKHGQTLLETKLRGLKVIIVLDDVNHVDQLTCLAGGHEWFGPGTRIIVTTTNIDLLNVHKIMEIYICEEMKTYEAHRLFCQSAFEHGPPTHVYEKWSDEIVKLAGGLPLALNVYGSMLYGKEESYWKEMLKKLQEYPPKDVLGRLEVVFARLDSNQQETFMYIACFLKGRDMDLVKDILTNIGLYSECGITDLMSKFLITINLEDSVWMHDLLQQMCWEILHKKSRGINGEHIAIKHRKDVVEVLSSKPEGMRSVEIINQERQKAEAEFSFDDPTCFSKMRKLKFLRISHIQFPQGLNYLSDELRILEWSGCPLKSLPTTFEPKHIYELEMCYSQLETLWEKYLNLPNLRSINLSFSMNLTKIPDLTSTINLVKLNLEGCPNLTELHKSVLSQKCLRYMNLKGCARLRNLGASTMKMEALEALLLSGCSSLKYIPDFGQNMKRLEHLYVDGTNIKKLPENLGQMNNLRKLDASGTFIEELPSYIHQMGKLRLLCANRCPFLFKTKGFLYKNLDTLSLGLRELDLSYCNLSSVPDGIGLLHHISKLDFSGNNFVSLPASISLLSNLKMFSLNDCKKLQLLPKLSLVNEDTLLYGLQIRFIYYISREGVDVSKFHATSNNNSPTISCLNCPKLALEESGNYLAGNILNSYLQLRTNYRMTPEAVFEIVGAGREIPSEFQLLKSDEHMTIEGAWVGVAICAVIYVHDIEAFMKAKYVVTVHIRVGEEKWKIPVTINFLVTGSENQLVFYLTVPGDLQRIVGSGQKINCCFSFSVEPSDANLKVTEFGVRFIHDEDILQLKLNEYSTSLVAHNLFQETLYRPYVLQESSYDVYDIDLFSQTIKFILGYGKHEDSLYGMHKISKHLLEHNHILLSECREEWRHTHLFALVYEYYRISHGISNLYNDFIRLLKDISNSWLNLKLALMQMVVKHRADDYTYAEMRQQLNDLEAATSVRFSNSFVALLAYICKQTVGFARHLNFESRLQGNKEFKSLKVLARLSCASEALAFSLAATYVGDSILLQEMKDTASHATGLHMLKCIKREHDKINRAQNLKTSFCRELPIWNFYYNTYFLLELKNKMPQSGSTKENEEKMMLVIDNLAKKIDDISKTIEDMSSHAYTYSHDITETGRTLNQYLADGKLKVTEIGVFLRPDEEIMQLQRFEDPIREAVSNLFRVTSALPAALHWYVPVNENSFSLYRPIQKATGRITKTMIKSILEHTADDQFHVILKFLECLDPHAIFIKDFPLMEQHRRPLLFFGRRTLRLEFLRIVSDVSKSWDSVKLTLEQILLKSRAGECTCEEMLRQLNDLDVVESSVFSDDFFKSFELICEHTASVLRLLNSAIYCKKFGEPAILRRVNPWIYRGKKVWRNAMKADGSEVIQTVIWGFSIMAICMGDFELLYEMVNITSSSRLLHLIQCFLRKSGKWFDERGCLIKKSNALWDCYGNAILLEELKKMSEFSSRTKEAEKEMMIVISRLDKKVKGLSGLAQVWR